MKLWVDDVRPAPEGYTAWVKSTDAAIEMLRVWMDYGFEIEVVDLDHDAGEYAAFGGDYIRVLDWLERIMVSLPIHIHSQNPVGVENMRRIIKRNGWKEV